MRVFATCFEKGDDDLRCQPVAPEALAPQCRREAEMRLTEKK